MQRERIIAGLAVVAVGLSPVAVASQQATAATRDSSVMAVEANHQCHWHWWAWIPVCHTHWH